MGCIIFYIISFSNFRRKYFFYKHMNEELW